MKIISNVSLLLKPDPKDGRSDLASVVLFLPHPPPAPDRESVRCSPALYAHYLQSSFNITKTWGFKIGGGIGERRLTDRRYWGVGTTVSTPVSSKCNDMESRVIYKFLHTLLVIIIWILTISSSSGDCDVVMATDGDPTILPFLFTGEAPRGRRVDCTAKVTTLVVREHLEGQIIEYSLRSDSKSRETRN